jgi:hypothetical protein
MALYKPGQTVIVTTEDKNQVGVIIGHHVFNKQNLYDVLLETRSAIIMISTASSKKTYINKTLTAKLCDTGIIETTVPYKTLLAEDMLPICYS